ncbi:GNAT family N-acetyltransferase [Verrucomicrobium sp. BvORR034]|uniref:GNAT family N-acetyltransferase n=1 Tax=Verrucomicrobium sp. BvORR034 TaxID=1396418 RepID=UPI0006788E34|nr:GNAT family N-acetyltransferase [Verrucomicrobium sp. BvORR034]
MIEIRRANSSDATSIAEIQVAGWRAAYRGIVPDVLLDGLDVASRVPFWERFSLGAKGDLYVAVLEGGVAGFCHLIPTRDPGTTGTAEIAAIYVNPATWRKGVGRKLCTTALHSAAERSYVRVTLWVLSGNQLGRRFYEAIGFEHDGAVKHEVMNGTQLEEMRYQIALPAPSGGHLATDRESSFLVQT